MDGSRIYADVQRPQRNHPPPDITTLQRTFKSGDPTLRALETAFHKLPANRPSSHTVHRNPLTRIIKFYHHQHSKNTATATIHLFDSFAYHVANYADQPWRVQPWETQVVAAYYEDFTGFRCRGGGACHAEGTGLRSQECPMDAHKKEGEQARNEAIEVIYALTTPVRRVQWKIHERLHPWMMRKLVGRIGAVRIQPRPTDGSEQQNVVVQAKFMELAPGDHNGLSMTVLRLPEGEYRDGQELNVCATAGTSACIPARIRVCSGTGFGIISTLEETLWQVDPWDAVSVLRNVFDDPKCTKGMSKILQRLKEKLENPPFWYITTAPRYLYPLVRGFRDKHLPFGVIACREGIGMTAADLLESFRDSTKQYKLEQLHKIYEFWPKRRMILIGYADGVS